ncbi:MAG: hypothetical protein U1D30_23180 [Planctomycetota bacterium]
MVDVDRDDIDVVLLLRPTSPPRCPPPIPPTPITAISIRSSALKTRSRGEAAKAPIAAD